MKNKKDGIIRKKLDEKLLDKQTECWEGMCALPFEHPDAGRMNIVKSVIRNSEFEQNSDPDKYYKYLRASVPERMEMLRAGSSPINEPPDWDQYAYFKTEHIKLMRKISKDEDLKRFFRYEVAGTTQIGRICRFMGQRIYQGRYGSGTAGHVRLTRDRSKALKHISGLEEYAEVFIPPKNRIKITDNITFNDLDVLPVYSDIENETIDNLEIPDVLTYNYIDTNFIDLSQEKHLGRAVFLSEDERNHIKCKCHSDQESIVPCYENEDCPCYQMNIKMMEFQVNNGKELAKFKTFEPMYFNNIKNAFYNYVSFACSELCDCSGKCTNNPLLLMRKKLFPIQIHRVDKNVGFKPFSPVFIPAGTLVTTFTGQIKENEHMEQSDVDYSYQITYNNDNKWIALITSMKDQFTDEYVELLISLAKLQYYINPKHHGNIGRTAAHSCVANMEVMRIYQKSLSPAHANLVMVTLEDIFPGTTLSIDYGYTFAEILEKHCKCGTFACNNNPKKGQFKNLSSLNLARCVQKIHEQRMKNFKENVVEPSKNMRKRRRN